MKTTAKKTPKKMTVTKKKTCPGCGRKDDHRVCKPIHVARTWPDGSYA